MSADSHAVRVGLRSRFGEGRPTRVRVAGVEVAVFNVGGRLFALRDGCPHMGASLAEGTLDGTRVTCHWHGWSFDLETGASDHRSGACAKVYGVELRGEEVWLTPPPERGPAPEDEEEWVPFDPERHLR